MKKSAKKQPATNPKIVLLIGLIVMSIGVILFFSVHGVSAQCKQSLERLSSMNVEQISLRNDFGKEIKIPSYIADNNSKRAAGYQHICADVIDTTHILFVYPQLISGQFHMQNVQAGLDIGFFDHSGRLISTMVMETYADGNNRLYSPERPFRYALEARVGFFNQHKLSAHKTQLVLSSVDGR